MTASSTHDQHVSLTATAARRECDIAPTTCSEHEGRPSAPILTFPCPSQAPSRGEASGSQHEVILISTDSESESMSESDGETDDDVPSPKKTGEHIEQETTTRPNGSSPASTMATVPNTPRDVSLGPAVDDDLDGAVQCLPSTSLTASDPPRQASRDGVDSSRRSPSIPSTEVAEQDHGLAEDANKSLSSHSDNREPSGRAKLLRPTQPHDGAGQNVLASIDGDGNTTNDGDCDNSRAADSDSSSDSDGGSDGDDDDYDDDGSSSDTDGEGAGHSKKRRTDRSPSVSSSDSGHADDPLHDNTESRPRPLKRQKVAHRADMTPVRTRNSMPRSARRQSPSPRRPETASMLSPQASHSLSESESDKGSDCSKVSTASFGEWQLQNAALKCVTIDGVTTYQLQFQRIQAHPSSQQTRRLRKAASSGRTSRSCKPTKFSAAEDRLLTQLKTGGELTWKEIHRQFDEEFPGRRSLGTLQVHYSTKLRGQGRR